MKISILLLLCICGIIISCGDMNTDAPTTIQSKSCTLQNIISILERENKVKKCSSTHYYDSGINEFSCESDIYFLEYVTNNNKIYKAIKDYGFYIHPNTNIFYYGAIHIYYDYIILYVQSDRYTSVGKYFIANQCN